MFFCVNLDPPIKQGQTRYHYLIFTFMQVRRKSSKQTSRKNIRAICILKCPQEDELELELPFSEEELKEKY